MNVNPSQIDLLARTLDVASVRHRVIAQNVANVNTPGYQRLEVAFEASLREAMSQGGTDAIRAVQPTVLIADTPITRADGNNVSMEQEMSDLNKNSLLYQATAQVLASRLATLRAAVTSV